MLNQSKSIFCPRISWVDKNNKLILFLYVKWSTDGLLVTVFSLSGKTVLPFPDCIKLSYKHTFLFVIFQLICKFSLTH